MRSNIHRWTILNDYAIVQHNGACAKTDGFVRAACDQHDNRARIRKHGSEIGGEPVTHLPLKTVGRRFQED